MTNKEFERLLAYAGLAKSDAMLKAEIEKAVEEAEAIANFNCDNVQRKGFSFMRADTAAASVKREVLLKNAKQAENGFFYLPEEGTL